MIIQFDHTEQRQPDGRPMPYGRAFAATDGDIEVIGCHHQGAYSQRYKYPDRFSIVVWDYDGGHTQPLRTWDALPLAEFRNCVAAAYSDKIRVRHET